MYALKPTRLYMLDAVQEDGQALARVERMVRALGEDMGAVRRVDGGTLHDAARELAAWPTEPLRDDVPLEHQRPLVFTRLTCGGQPEDDPRFADRPEGVPAGILAHLLGYIDPVRDFHTPESDTERNMVCWPTRDFGVMQGCSHGCFYCGDGRFGKYLAIGANLEEYAERVVEPTIQGMPQQRCFRMIGWGADIISLEPEYGIFGLLLERLARHDRYGYFHSNSDHVDWIAGLPNRDRLIGVWSMACDAMARLIEPGSPSPDERIEAIRKCQTYGLPVRVKLKPVVPIRDWREEYASLIRRIFERTRPETIGFCVLIWMDLARVADWVGLELLDPEFVHAAEEAKEQMNGQTHAPFPHEVRAEIYRFLIGEVRKWSADIPIFLSTETREMWTELESEVGQKATHFMCGCNPIQVPGPKMKYAEKMKRSTFFAPAGNG
jgi:spore photoproduct lyase